MANGDKILKVAHPKVIGGAACTAWGAAAIMHAAHVGPLDPALATLALGGLTYGSRFRTAAGSVVTAGAWMTAATWAGPLYGPFYAMSLAWATGAAVTLIVVHRHEAVRSAKRWREARFQWLHTAARYGLGGSHLIEHEETRLGDRQVLDTTATGKLASQIASSALAERIAQDEGLPLSRVRVHSPKPGRLEISKRYQDPWSSPITHPVLDRNPELHLTVPCTVHQPLPVGQDPESGKPLTLTVWDGDGAKNILIVAKKRAGKTTLLSCLRERVTAAADAELWNINLSKSIEDREWAGACHRSASGPHDVKKALGILREARQIIDRRGATPRETPVFQPSPADPLIVLTVDEVDALVELGGQAARRDLAYIASKNGSEGVALVIAGQRGTADWMGGSNVRTQIDYVCIGKVGRRGEVMHAAGDAGLLLPDMASYGEGKPGVWVIAETGGDFSVGRTFNLRELTDIRKIATARRVAAAAHAGGRGSWAPPATSEDALALVHQVVRQHEAEDASTLDRLDREVEAYVPDDLRGKIEAIDAKNAEAKKIAAEAGQVLESLPEVPPERMAAAVGERWDQAAEQTTIPDDVREKLMRLLAASGGVSVRKAAEVFPDVKRWKMALWFNRLRWEGVACIHGKGRSATWRLAEPAPGGDTE